jgi:methylglutaconyl-CoA hydratase
MAQTVLLESQGPVAYVTMNRPEVHNAFNEELIDRLTRTFSALSLDDSVRVIVLSGAGKSFCAGADLDWMRRMASYSYEDNVADARLLHALFETIDTCTKITVANVHGAALGGGAGLVAACDIALAAPETKFGFTEVRLGLIPAVIAPFVVNKIGMGRARPLFVTGRRFEVGEALEMGLVQSGTLEKTLTEALQAAPDAVARAKALLHQLNHGVADTAAAIAAARASDQGKEGLSAFLEKRRPQWSVS